MSLNLLSGRKQVKIGRSKLARDIKQKDEQLKKLTTQLDRYKKRIQRQRSLTIKSTPSPATKIRRLTANVSITKEIKNKLLFGEVLLSTLTGKKKEKWRKKHTVGLITGSEPIIIFECDENQLHTSCLLLAVNKYHLLKAYLKSVMYRYQWFLQLSFLVSTLIVTLLGIIIQTK